MWQIRREAADGAAPDDDGFAAVAVPLPDTEGATARLANVPAAMRVNSRRFGGRRETSET
ncbi:MAG: hypothetical protein ACO3QA_13055 [Phycisphaerales bacterium]